MSRGRVLAGLVAAFWVVVALLITCALVLAMLMQPALVVSGIFLVCMVGVLYTFLKRAFGGRGSND